MKTDCTKTDGWKAAQIKTKVTCKEKTRLFKLNYLETPNLCKQCSCKLPFEKRSNKFCSHSCSASFNNKGVRRHGYENILEFCLHCNTKLTTQKKFCDIDCKNDYYHQQFLLQWKCGNHNGLRGEYNLSAHIRRYIFEKYDSKCCQCGWDEKHPSDGKIPLDIDHIDGDNNNNEDNLRLLCPNCHSLTLTYKSRNKNGRKQRKKYYKKCALQL
jgi:hypothetical protein